MSNRSAAQRYAKMRWARTILVVFGWIFLVASPLVLIGCVIAGVFTASQPGPSAASTIGSLVLFPILGLVYAVMLALYAILCFGVAEWMSLSLDVEDQVRYLRERMG